MVMFVMLGVVSMVPIVPIVDIVFNILSRCARSIGGGGWLIDTALTDQREPGGRFRGGAWTTGHSSVCEACSELLALGRVFRGEGDVLWFADRDN
jgi:hypothetical protein